MLEQIFVPEIMISLGPHENNTPKRLSHERYISRQWQRKDPIYMAYCTLRAEKDAHIVVLRTVPIYSYDWTR